MPIQGNAERPNLSVTAVSLQRSRFANQERVAVTAGITNRSETAVTNQPVHARGRRPPGGGQDRSACEGGASTSVSFDPVTIGGRNYKGTVRLGEDALLADNAFNFVVSPSEPVHVVLVDRGGAGAGAGLYVAQALVDRRRAEVRHGHAPAREPDRRGSAQDLPRGPQRRGGHAAARAAAAEVRRTRAAGCWWRQARARHGRREVDVLPATLGNPVDRTRGDAARVGGIEFGHPVFEAVPRAAQRRLRVGRGCTATAIWHRPLARRCWPGSTPGRPPSSSAASGPGACCCGRRRSTSRGPTCRSGRSSCRSSTARPRTWWLTSRRSRGLRWGRSSTPRGPARTRARACRRSC